MRFIGTLMRLMLPYKALGWMFVLCLLVEVAYAAAAPLSLKYMVDEAFTPRNFHAFLVILLLLLGGGLLNIGASFGGDYALGNLGGRMIRKLRIDLFTHLQRQSLPFYQHYQIGDLVTRFSTDMNAVERVVRVALPFFLKEALGVVLGLILLFSIEWKLTLAMLAGSTLMFVGPRLMQRRTETANVRYKEAQERFTNTIDEMVKGHKTIRSLHLQERFQERARKQAHELFSFGLNVHLAGSLMERLPLMALLLLNGIMIGFGGYLIFHDQMTVGGFMAFFTLFLSVGQSGSSLSFLIPNLIDSSISFRRIRDVLDQPPSVPEAPHPLALPPSLPGVRMDEVTFGYSEETEQLKQVNLRIAPGSYAAFIGTSGSGKSTALQLLSRFYDPRQGTVAIGEHDLRTVSEASLRNTVTLVTQDTFLFHTTIRDNLLQGSGVSEEDMIEAAKQANIHEVIAGWPDGYDTMVHHGGGSLSGGERQRIAIARALLRRPKLLLLDEVTSALDPATEADINGLLERLRSKTTIVAVTHRLASVQHADCIYVFRDGRIADSGTHRELLDRSELYRSLWEKQFGFHLSQDGLHATVELERLAKFPFFEGVALPLLQDIASLFATETCKEGEPVVSEGEQGNKFYMIVRGKFEVLKRMENGAERRVAVLQDGDHFGEIALLHNIPRTATVKALGPSVLLSLRQEAFHRLMDEHPNLKLALERILLTRIG
ncbi:ABC transporter transmembrane domain-containing protein [Paenibacillus cymbidii]|uniref:ABC transporter transmembrane domain-containing protein n=1 Tax=Paenibacillus cymbidii TaxID=1639034 RepID=UPI0010809D9C|nr:ABC transporter transmembrane domain-containing protein [Paenibacillus cymbidii]